MQSARPRTQADQMREDLRKLEDPGWGGGMNILYGDGYFANSLVQKYQMSIDEMHRHVDQYATKPATADVTLTQLEIEVLMIAASNYTFSGRKPNPKAISVAIAKLRRAHNRAFGPKMKFTRT